MPKAHSSPVGIFLIGFFKSPDILTPDKTPYGSHTFAKPDSDQRTGDCLKIYSQVFNTLNEIANNEIGTIEK
uniref:Uncharacterized protein n=1 Tax=Romanomermis culicivorax TaxID=13658 RepID=A0A915K5X9_ROMCU